MAVNYAIYYPLFKPYSSLYPRTTSGKDESDDIQEGNIHQPRKSQEAKGDPEMWKAVEKAMKQGTLDELRNSDSGRSLARTRESDDQRKLERQDEKTDSIGPSQYAADTETCISHQQAGRRW